MPKQIVYLRSSFEPGGIESLLIDIFNYKQSDFVFHYVLLKKGSQIPLLQSNTNKLYSYFRKGKFDLRVIFKLVKLIRKEKIKIIHTHQPIELFYAVLTKILIPHIHIYHTIHGYMNSKWKILFEKSLIRFTHNILTVSYTTLNHYVALGYPSKNFKVLYNAVNIEPDADNLVKDKFYNAIHYTPGEKIVGMIGNFVWWKDQLTIIRAFNKIADNVPNVKLVFIGFDETDEGVIAKNEATLTNANRIYFLNRFPNAASCLPLFNGFVFSSIADTFGIVLVEAMLNGVPVIASNIDVCNEISVQGKYFDLFETGNVDDLALKLLKMLNNASDFKRLEDARSYCLKSFSMETYFVRLKELYK